MRPMANAPARSAIQNVRRRALLDTYEVSSVRKALKILCSFSVQQPQWTLSALSRLVGLPKSTTHNLLHTLEKFGFVQRGDDGRHYVLGPKLYELGGPYWQSADVAERATPHLRRLAVQTGETAKLGVLSDGRVLIIAAVESSYELHTRGDAGSSWWLHSTALGKAILACLSSDEIDGVVERHGLPRVTRATVGDREGLDRALQEVRRQGYAIDWEESEQGVCCVATPVPVAPTVQPMSLSVSGPLIRLSRDALRSLVPQLASEAAAIGRLIPAPSIHVPAVRRR